VAVRSETFNADLYLSVRWRDVRLASGATEPQRFLEEAAVEQLKHMWCPNSSTPPRPSRRTARSTRRLLVGVERRAAF